MNRIETLAQLRDVLGHPSELTKNKIYHQLNAQMRDFISRSPLLLLATTGEDGVPTVSPKGDAPGFVHVDDEGRLLLPERLGNKLVSSFQHLLENPHAGLLFMVPRCTETLRVSGTAEILHDAELALRLQAQAKPALLVTRITVTEAYFHCGKALIRSSLWKPEQWPEESRVSFGKEIGQNMGCDADFATNVDTQVQLRYQDSLY
jgi:uncharacterized protein